MVIFIPCYCRLEVCDMPFDFDFTGSCSLEIALDYRKDFGFFFFGLQAGFIYQNTIEMPLQGREDSF